MVDCAIRFTIDRNGRRHRGGTVPVWDHDVTVMCHPKLIRTCIIHLIMINILLSVVEFIVFLNVFSRTDTVSFKNPNVCKKRP